MLVSQVQLAQKLGVSQRTVSSALHGSGRVGAALRKRILAAAEQHGYRPNRLAAGLRGSRTSSIGIVWAFVDPWAGDASIALDITRRFQEHGFAVYQALHDPSVDVLGHRIDDLLDRRIDALVVQATPGQLAHPEIQRRLRATSVAVTVSREAVSGLPADQVVHDRIAAIREVVDHLAACGRRRPCMVLAMSEESNPPKYGAFVDAWAAHGVSQTETMLVDMTARSPDGETSAPHPAYEEHGLRHRTAFVARFPRSLPLHVDCVFCFNDTGAFYVLRELQDRGLRVPGDVAVVGFNNDQAGAVWSPPLASGDRCPRDVSTTVTRLLEHRLAGGTTACETVTVPMHFIWRESAGVPTDSHPTPAGGDPAKLQGDQRCKA